MQCGPTDMSSLVTGFTVHIMHIIITGLCQSYICYVLYISLEYDNYKNLCIIILWWLHPFEVEFRYRIHLFTWLYIVYIWRIIWAEEKNVCFYVCFMFMVVWWNCSGEMKGTIHRMVMKEYAAGLQTGSVLVLRQVCKVIWISATKLLLQLVVSPYECTQDSMV